MQGGRGRREGEVIYSGDNNNVVEDLFVCSPKEEGMNTYSVMSNIQVMK